MRIDSLQLLVKSESKLMNDFFKSQGEIMPPKQVLLNYKELATRILTNTKGAYQKLTPKVIESQARRVKMIDEALKKI